MDMLEYRNAMELMWDEYIQYCAKNGLTGQDIARVCELTLGFAGAELFRRVVGTAHVVDLDSIQEEAQKVSFRFFLRNTFHYCVNI